VWGILQAALEFLLQSYRQPDIIHTHDWPTAMAAKFFWEDYHSFGLWKPKVLHHSPHTHTHHHHHYPFTDTS
jgi:starch synthase